MILKGNLNLDTIEQVEFPHAQYFRVDHPKTQIVLHHSAGWDNARGMFRGWAEDKERVATCCGIIDNGTIFQIFSSAYWAYHVNIASKGNKQVKEDPIYAPYFPKAVDIENRTIGVEVCAWGGLVLIDGRYHTWASKRVNPKHKTEITVDERKVVYYPDGFRGYNYFEAYTDAELESLWKLLRHWCQRYSIPTCTVGDIFELNVDAFKGTPGIYTHCSYRIDKQDMHPQPELLKMLLSL